MSMVVKVSVEVKDYRLLKKTLEKMNYTLIEEEGTEAIPLTNSEIHYCGIVTNKTGKHLCYVQQEHSVYRLVSVSDALGKHKHKRMLDEILQNYAYQEVMETARQNGWTTVNTRETDGTIRIRLAV